MTASSFARHKVNDFASWKKVYDENIPLRKEDSDLIAESVHRDPDDPNTIIVYHQYADLSTAQKFLAAMNDEAFQTILAEAGVQPETLEIWVGEDV
ncbi:MAG: cyclase [Anaerolineae bacterium]